MGEIDIVNESELTEESRNFAGAYLKDEGFEDEKDLATKHYIQNAARDGFAAGVRWCEKRIAEIEC